MTAATYLKEHHFRGRARLDVLQHELLTAAAEFGWRLEAWALFSNHYHFIAQTPEGASDTSSLSPMMSAFHAKTARKINQADGAPNRQVWYNFREARLTCQKSYLARLSYVHQNPVKHGLVPVANQYPWCSAAWFESVVSRAIVESIYRFKIDAHRIEDSFAPTIE